MEGGALVTRYIFPVVGYKGPVNLHWGNVSGGSDIFAVAGTPLVAMTNGRVVLSGWNSVGGWAVQMIGDDGLHYYYAHLREEPVVKSNQRVTAGQLVGTVGDTGNAQRAGPHLHIGIGPTIRSGADKYGGTGGDYDAVGLMQASLRIDSIGQPPEPEEEDMARIEELEAENAELVNALAYVCDDLGDKLETERYRPRSPRKRVLHSVVEELRRVRHQFLGPRP